MTDSGNPFERYPSVTPYLYYPDAAAAIDWLARAFGFRERGRKGRGARQAPSLPVVSG